MEATLFFIALTVWSLYRVISVDGVNKVNAFGYIVGVSGTIISAVV